MPARVQARISARAIPVFDTPFPAKITGSGAMSSSADFALRFDTVLTGSVLLNSSTAFALKTGTNLAGNITGLADATATLAGGDGGGSSGSREGDETALDDMSASISGFGASWNTPISLSSPPSGVTVDTIGGELRVIKIDIRSLGLAGNINNVSIGNLTEMTLLNFMFNSLNTPIPSELGNCTSLEYLYACGSDATSDLINNHPHEWVASQGDIHPGKHKGNENNVIAGSLPASIPQNCPLKGFMFNWTDAQENDGSGLTSIAPEWFNIPTCKIWQIYKNGGISEMTMPSGFSNSTSLTHFSCGGNGAGYLTGSVPNITNLTNMVHMRFSDHIDLVIDFDVRDFSGWTNLETFVVAFMDTRGNLPGYFFDGTMPNINSFVITWPQGPKMDGQLPEFTNQTNLKTFSITDQDFSGAVPGSFWDNSRNINVPSLQRNNLTSIRDDGTADLTLLRQIRNLHIYENNIGSESFPNLDWENQQGAGADPLRFYTRFNVAHNKYVFRDMLEIPGNQSGNLTLYELHQSEAELEFNVFPQQRFGSQSNYNDSTGIIDFSSSVSHADNSYQWTRNGSNVGPNSSSIDTDSFGSGDYELIVTNSNIPGEELKSVIITA